MTDGNYTVAWLVADENDGAGYYEDDEDDQVLVDLCLLCTFYLFNLNKLIMNPAIRHLNCAFQTTFGACDHYLDRSVSCR